MKKLLLIASLLSVGCAFAMEDTTLLSIGDVFDVQKLQQENLELRKERSRFYSSFLLFIRPKEGVCWLERLSDDENGVVSYRLLEKFNVVVPKSIRNEIVPIETEISFVDVREE